MSAADLFKEALADGLGTPGSVEESQRLGCTAVLTMLTVARGCSGAVLDSTWFDDTRPLLAQLDGRLVEVRCRLPRELARQRYRARVATRHTVHLDLRRAEGELWGAPVRALGVGPLVEVDTGRHVDVTAVAAEILRAVGRPEPARH